MASLAALPAAQRYGSTAARLPLWHSGHAPKPKNRGVTAKAASLAERAALVLPPRGDAELGARGNVVADPVERLARTIDRRDGAVSRTAAGSSLRLKRTAFR